MKTTGAMRIMATSHAVQEMARAGGADVDEIKMFLVWLEKILVVQMPDGNEGKLQAMVSRGAPHAALAPNKTACTMRIPLPDA